MRLTIRRSGASSDGRFSAKSCFDEELPCPDGGRRGNGHSAKQDDHPIQECVLIPEVTSLEELEDDKKGRQRGRAKERTVETHPAFRYRRTLVTRDAEAELLFEARSSAEEPIVPSV